MLADNTFPNFFQFVCCGCPLHINGYMLCYSCYCRLYSCTPCCASIRTYHILLLLTAPIIIGSVQPLDIGSAMVSLDLVMLDQERELHKPNS